MGNRFTDKLAMYADLTPDDVAAIDKLMDNPRDYRARHDLIREGDKPGPMFIALDGWVCRYKILPSGTRQIMAFMMPGDSCDLHVRMLDEMDHSIQTVTNAKVSTVAASDMHDLMSGHPNIARAMYVSQLVDEGIMRAWIVSMGRRSSIERVAHLMCELYLRARNIGLAKEEHFALPLSQNILADALGMTSVHINRVLRELRESGAMTLGRGQLIILDPRQLIQIAGFDENYLHRRIHKAA